MVERFKTLLLPTYLMRRREARMEVNKSTTTLLIFLTDLRLIYNSEHLDPERSPSHLQRKVMFDIRYYMCRRGGENIKDMTKETFQLCFDNETKISYVKKVLDEMTKNHQECDN